MVKPLTMLKNYVIENLIGIDKPFTIRMIIKNNLI